MRSWRMIFAALIIAVVCLGGSSRGWSQAPVPKPGTSSPAITHSFAQDTGSFGTLWKIYIEADDPDGDMWRIVSSVDQPGFKGYAPDIVFLRGGDRKHFKGYLRFNTFSNKTDGLPNGTVITLRVQVFDKAGNGSNEAVFPFEFTSGRTPVVPPPAPFDDRSLPRLGSVMIDLIDPHRSGDGNGSFDSGN
jgi:hypothetical protein